MGDAARGVAPQLVDLLKAVTGEDEVQLDRKGLPPFVGKLPLRFLIVCNTMPRLIDQSGAFMRRMVLLNFQQSFEANPDETLDARLAQELPGIVNFALRGLKDLYTERRFTQPDSGRAVLETCRRQTSPIRAFCEDCLEPAEAPTPPVKTTEVYDAYRAWCAHAGRQPINRESFIPLVADHLRTTVARSRVGGDARSRVLLGFKLSLEGNACLNGFGS